MSNTHFSDTVVAGGFSGANLTVTAIVASTITANTATFTSGAFQTLTGNTGTFTTAVINSFPATTQANIDHGTIAGLSDDDHPLYPVQVAIPLTIFIEKNQRFLDENIHGHLTIIATAQALNSGANIAITNGLSKLIVVPKAGTVSAGTFTITGTTVNRDTGVTTGSQSNQITSTGFTVDSSANDANGNEVHALTGGYISSDWFLGAVTITTSALALTDVDVYQCTFEQFNDARQVTLDTFDITTQITNTNGQLDAYLYSVIVTGSVVDIQTASALHIADSDVTANLYYRLRKGNIGVGLSGATDGLFVNLFLRPDTQTYFSDLTMKVWGLCER